MYDIMINKNGSLYLAEGDLKDASYERYISQRLYAATMEMPPDLINGTSLYNKANLDKILMQYYIDYFRSDIDINPANIEIVINDAIKNEQGVTFNLSYSGRTPDGKIIDYASTFDYDLTAGALLSVDYETSYLITLLYKDKYEVKEHIKIADYTSEIELSVTPMPGPDLEQPLYPVMLMTPQMMENYTESVMPFTITTDGKRKLYQIDNYVTGFNRNSHTLQKLLTITLSDDSMDCRIMEKYGNLLIRTNSIGTINGTVSVATALQITSKLKYDKKYISSQVYKMKPTDGNCIAIFPKTVVPGDYVLKYTGIR